MLTEFLPKIIADDKFKNNEVSKYFFCLLIKILLTDFLRMTFDSESVVSLCQKCDIKMEKIQSDLNKEIQRANPSNKDIKIGMMIPTSYRCAIQSISKVSRQEGIEIGDIFDKLRKSVNLNDLLNQFIQSIYTRDSNAIDEDDYPLNGILKIIEILILKYPDSLTKIERIEFLKYLLSECLFKFDGDILTDDAKYHNQKIRKTSIDLLFSMLNQKYPSEDKIFIAHMEKVMDKTKWRGFTRKSWSLNYNPSNGINSRNSRRKEIRAKSNSKKIPSFVGLNNLSNTCYMNSIMQHFFMIPCFRDSILKADNTNQNEVLHQSKFMIYALLKVSHQSYTPYSFFNSLTDVTGEKFNPMEQKDADEFFSRYLDLLEEALKGTKESKIINNLFQGKFLNQMICQDTSKKLREESFITLNLPVKNYNNIIESLDSLIESEVIKGNNSQIESLKVRIKQLPNILVTVLKRFEMNYEAMNHKKINSRFEFPLKINMKKYTVESMEKEQVEEEMREKNLILSDLDEDQMEILNKNYPEDYYEYELKGIVIHSGEANAGHYYSYINDRLSNESNQWYEFNDAMVMPFDIHTLDEKAFGGSSKLTYIDEQGIQQEAITENSANAYMLFYERKQMYLWETIGDKEELIKVDGFNMAQIPTQAIEEKKEEIADLLGLSTEEQEQEQDKDKDKEEEDDDEYKVPQEFMSIIQNINIKQWQIKYIFCGEMLESFSQYLRNIEIYRLLQ